jgi:alkanesulfonate monooxygenase
MAEGGFPLRVGVALKNFTPATESPDIDELLAYAERAEALGFESLWAWDHILLGTKRPFPILESLTTLAAIAARTTRIKLGTGVLVLSLRNPVVLAKILGTLDCLSKGRLVLGAAAGWYEREFTASNIPHAERGKRFLENLRVLLDFWGDGPPARDRGPYAIRGAVMLPPPAQRPRPPILIGGYVEAVLRRVARHGDGWLTYFYTPESFTKSWTKIQGHAREFGRDPATLDSANQLPIHVGPPAAQADAPLKAFLGRYFDIAPWSESTMDSGIAGTVEECAAQLQRHIAAGARRLILVPYEYRLEQLEIIAREVVPRLRG